VNLNLYQIPQTSSLRAALEKIEQNLHGLILTTNEQGAVVGLATDGDIRRSLLEGVSLDDRIGQCANLNFIWADENASREMLLKQLNKKIRLIPLLDDDKKLKGVVSDNYLPTQQEVPVYARARAPARISFSGGGSDLTHFFINTAGAVINSTIAIYSHATLRLRSDQRIIVHSSDLNDTLHADNLSDALTKEGHFGLILAVLKVVEPDHGFELYLDSDFPMKSGLGGSAVVSAVILGCFNQFRRDRWDLHELAELAFQAERLYLGIAGGWQDQYASVFGGFNFMEFNMEQNIVHPLRIHPDVLLELEENLVLCDSNLEHDSGNIHVHQEKQMQQAEVNQKVKESVELTYEMRNHLLRGRLSQFGRDLDKAWHLKRKFSDMISDPQLDEIYDIAMAHGALGGKLLGAGGGGFFLFYVPAIHKLDLVAVLHNNGRVTRQFRFEEGGLRAWTVREENNKTG